MFSAINQRQLDHFKYAFYASQVGIREIENWGGSHYISNKKHAHETLHTIGLVLISIITNKIWYNKLKFKL